MNLAFQIEALPPDIRQEVIDFMEYLLEKRKRQRSVDPVDQNLDAVLSLHRLGAEIWQGTDPDQYIAELRADW